MNISNKIFSYSGPFGLIVEIDGDGRHIDDGLIIGTRLHNLKLKATEDAATLILNHDDHVILVNLDSGPTFLTKQQFNAGSYTELVAYQDSDHDFQPANHGASK